MTNPLEDAVNEKSKRLHEAKGTKPNDPPADPDEDIEGTAVSFFPK